MSSLNTTKKESVLSREDTPDAYWTQGHCFPVVLDEKGVPSYYQTTCAYCGEHIANLWRELKPCQKTPTHHIM